MPSLADIVNRQMVAAAEPEKYHPRDNRLFACLYDAWCGLTGTEDSFEAVNGRACYRNRLGMPGLRWPEYENACKAIRDWYVEHYPRRTKSDGRGRDRVVTEEVMEGRRPYQFDLPFKPELFQEYLIQGASLRKGDGHSFLMHTSVAFLLPPERLEELLKYYGYHPLHPRNIHQLAIYAVLNSAPGGADRASYNPFPDLRGLYEEARDLALGTTVWEGEAATPAEEAAFQGNSTRMAGRFLKDSNLTGARLLGYVGRHAEFYSARHTRLLREHGKMANLFAVLYIPARRTGKSRALPEEEYSLLSFVNRFARPLERRRFFDHIHNKIVREGRHPTREAMILMWMFSYCFQFLHDVYMDRDMRRVVPFHNPPEFPDTPTHPFRDFCDNGYLHVFRYLSDPGDRASPLEKMGGQPPLRNFQGAEMTAFLNGKLRDYGWRPLDGRVPFDRTILELGKLELELNSAGNLYRGRLCREWIDDIRTMDVPNVPAPLTVLCEVLKNMAARDNVLPLECDLYELI